MHLIRVKEIHMNRTLVFSAVISATVMIATACKKEEQAFVPEDQYFASDAVVKRGQTAFFGFKIGTEWKGDWTVSPTDGTKIYPEELQARILFTQPGQYVVTARAKNGGQVFTDTVLVVDSPYTAPYAYPGGDPAADDIITLEPIPFRDDVLVFHAVGKKTYSCLSYFVYQNNSTSTAVSIDMGIPSSAAVLCMVGPWPAPSSLIYTRGYANGVHPVTIRLGDSFTTYTGTLTVTDDKYTFSWPDNIPVVIRPKQIDRVK
jgi:hypothetical protein